MTPYKVNLPNGATATVELPTALDQSLVDLALAAFVGGLVALSKCDSSETQRDFLIRYTASAVNSADLALHSVAMANSVESNNQKKIIDNLLDSLHD